MITDNVNPIGSNFAEVAGVYAIINNSKQVIYIGQTDNLRRRMNEHLNDTTHCMHRYGPSLVGFQAIQDEATRLTVERELINQFRPPCNQ